MRMKSDIRQILYTLGLSQYSPEKSKTELSMSFGL